MAGLPDCSFHRVFSNEEATALKEVVNSQPREAFSLEESNNRRRLRGVQPLSHRYEDPKDSWFPVTFGALGEVETEEVTTIFSNCQGYDTLRKIVAVALRWMAEKMEWRGTTKEMAISFMQHRHLQQGEPTREIGWHRDNSDRTLVILLDDETEWEGGRFLFKKLGEEPSLFHPQRGYGVLFTNAGTQHYLEPFAAKRNGVDRTILTIHERHVFFAKNWTALFRPCS